MSNESIKALSIRQPWAWLILNAGKDIENRDWSPHNPGLKFRGLFLIHTGRNLFGTIKDRDQLRDTLKATRDIVIPADDDLPRGGIVGKATIVDIVTASPSFWFTGPIGLQLANVRRMPFRTCTGKLGFFIPKDRGGIEP